MTIQTTTAADTQADRVERIVSAVRAHGSAIESAEQGVVRVSWGDGSIKVVVEIHYKAEVRR